MIVNIFYGNNIDSYLATALLFFYIKNKNSDYNINLVNIDTLELKTTTLEDPILVKYIILLEHCLIQLLWEQL